MTGTVSFGTMAAKTFIAGSRQITTGTINKFRKAGPIQTIMTFQTIRIAITGSQTTGIIGLTLEAVTGSLGTAADLTIRPAFTK